MSMKNFQDLFENIELPVSRTRYTEKINLPVLGTIINDWNTVSKSIFTEKQIEFQ